MPTPLGDPDDVDLCAGPGGWDVAAAALGLHPLGLEVDGAAIRTRHAAGHRTLGADIATVDPSTVARAIRLLIASPPCQLYSAAGTGYGRLVLGLLADAIPAVLAGDPSALDRVRTAIADAIEPLLDADVDDAPPTLDLGGLASATRAEAEAIAAQAALVLEPARWIAAARPRHVALEQVPGVQPLWTVMAEHLRLLGYSVATGILNAADYGVPQTRRRAILAASLDHDVALPTPTHAGAWVSMEDATGIVGRLTTCANQHGQAGNPLVRDTDEPAPTLVSNADRWKVATGQNSMVSRDGTTAPYERSVDEPSPTVTGQARAWQLRPGSFTASGNRRRYDLDEPAPTLHFGHDTHGWAWEVALNTGRDWKPGGSRADAQTIPVGQPAPTLGGVSSQFQWVVERPATTIAGDARCWPPGHKVNADDIERLGEEEARARYGDRAGTDAITLTVEEAAALQTFPIGYPWQGGRGDRFRQVGDAVPPLLALHVLAAALGVEADPSALPAWRLQVEEPLAS